MFQKLVNHNDDLKQLLGKGYALSIHDNYMVIRDIPYLNNQTDLQNGVIVTPLVFKTTDEIAQKDHQIYFSGSHPCGIEGRPIPNLGNRKQELSLSDSCNDFQIQRSFSNKLNNAVFPDFYEKIEHYVNIISGPAMHLNPNTTPYTFKKYDNKQTDSVFHYADTLTSLSELMDLSQKFKNDSIAIIGAGGTGSYILDFLVKTPVKEIRVFDNDIFYVHNSFRSPGKQKEEDFNKAKIDVYKARYESFRSGLSFKNKIIDSSSKEDLQNITFAFVCVDKGVARSNIFDLLISLNIPFIDVGMGLNKKNNTLGGLARVTYYSQEKAKITKDKNLAPLTDNIDADYKTNIQISELNALNACLAVIKFKQIKGFYSSDNDSIYHFLFGINDLKISCEKDED